MTKKCYICSTELYWDFSQIAIPTRIGHLEIHLSASEIGSVPDRPCRMCSIRILESILAEEELGEIKELQREVHSSHMCGYTSKIWAEIKVGDQPLLLRMRQAKFHTKHIIEAIKFLKTIPFTPDT